MIKHRLSTIIAVAVAAVVLPWTGGAPWGANAAAFVPHARSVCVRKSSTSGYYKTTTPTWRSITMLSSTADAEDQQREQQQEVSHCVPLQNIQLDDIARFGG
jgi:hypothetical protein